MLDDDPEAFSAVMARLIEAGPQFWEDTLSHRQGRAKLNEDQRAELLARYRLELEQGSTRESFLALQDSSPEYKFVTCPYGGLIRLRNPERQLKAAETEEKTNPRLREKAAAMLTRLRAEYSEFAD